MRSREREVCEGRKWGRPRPVREINGKQPAGRQQRAPARGCGCESGPKRAGGSGAERSSAAGTRAGRGRRGEPGARGTASSRGAAPVVSLRTLTAPGAAPGKDGGRKAPAGPAQPHVLPTRAPHGGLRAQDVVCVCECVCMYVCIHVFRSWKEASQLYALLQR